MKKFSIFSFCCLLMMACSGNSNRYNELNRRTTNLQLGIELLKDTPNTKKIKSLIRDGANVNAKSDNIVGNTLLINAAGNKNAEIVKILIDAGADINARNDLGKTALHEAVEFNYDYDVEVANVLIASGSNINSRSNTGWTPLMGASNTAKNPKIITTLINAGADVNAKSNDGRTALMCASTMNKNSDIIKVLLDAGADIYAKDNSGQTAIDMAQKEKNYGAVKILKSYYK